MGSRATVLSNKRITTTIKSRVVSEQLVEVNNDCPFQAARAYEAQNGS